MRRHLSYALALPWACLLATGCLHESTTAPPQEPVATEPPATTEPQETAQPAPEPEPTPSAPTMSTHEMLVASIVCALDPQSMMGPRVGSWGGGPSTEGASDRAKPPSGLGLRGSPSMTERTEGGADEPSTGGGPGDETGSSTGTSTSAGQNTPSGGAPGTQPGGSTGMQPGGMQGGTQPGEPTGRVRPTDVMRQGMQPGGSMGGMQPGGATPGMQPGGSMGAMPGSSDEAHCGPVARAVGISPMQLRTLEEPAVRSVREAIEKRAGEERLDDAMRTSVLAMYDKSMGAAREAMRARQVADRYTMMGAERTERTMPSRGGPSAARGATRAPTEPTIDADDARSLAAHDRLRDLVQFARTADAGPLATEAEAVGWITAADRFLRVESLPQRMRVLAAEPLLDGMLGVSPPTGADDPAKMPPTAWSSYLDAASRSLGLAGTGPSGSIGPAAGHGEKARAGDDKKTGKPDKAGKPGHAAPGKGAAAPKGARRDDQTALRDVMAAVAQRMDGVSHRMPASELRSTLDGLAARMRGADGGVGGGLQNPRGAAPPSRPRSTGDDVPMPPGGATSPGPTPRQTTPGFPGPANPDLPQDENAPRGPTPFTPSTPPGAIPGSPAPTQPPGGSGSDQLRIPGSPGPYRP